MVDKVGRVGFAETGSRAAHRANSSVVSTKGFDPARWMDLYCGLANARYALELWEREYAVAAWRGAPIPEQMLEWCRERGRRECESLSELERLVRPIACSNPASAVEARSDATPKSDAAEGESAVAKRDAQPPSGSGTQDRGV